LKGAQQNREVFVASETPKLKQIIDPVLAKALTHPMRGHILLVIGERGVASPKELGRALRMDLKEVSYHVRSLKARRLIRLVRTERRRGVREHYYELTEPLVYFDDSDWERLPRQIKGRFSFSLLKTAVADAVDALRVGTFDTADCHHSRMTMPVDEQGRREATEVLRTALDRLVEIQHGCAARMTLPSDEAIPFAVYMAAFETAAGAERGAGGAGG
jgi:DNA-binding transcriptional ArsR family regulator